MHTKLNHKYLSMQQLSQKIAAKVKKVSKLNIQVEKKNAALKELKAEIHGLRVNMASLKNDRLEFLLNDLDDKFIIPDYHHFKDCEALEDLIRLLNNSFDVMNAWRPADGITETNWNGADGRREVLSNLYQCLEETKIAACGISPSNELEDKVLLCGDSQDDFHSKSEEQLSLIKKPPVVDIDLEWGSWAATVYSHTWKFLYSNITLNGLRVTIMSTIDVVELHLRENYRYVLTEKLNQDCIERFFLIIRMSGRCGDKPTAASILELFRLLTLYYTTKQVLRGANCGGEERSVVLTSYSSCIKKRFSNNKKLMKEKPDYIRDILLQGIMREMDLVDSAENEDLSTENDDTSTTTQTPASSKIDVLDCNIIYYFCGYMVHSFRQKGRRVNSSFCQSCLATVNISPEELPVNFTACQLTEIKKRGYLIFSSYKIFQLICVVEENFLKLAKHDRIFMKNSYEAILLLISGAKLSLIGCVMYRKSLISDVIFQYLTLRFRCFGKKRFVHILEKKRGEAHARMKMKKLRKFARK
ncbi:uncharacterized protein LOC116927568 [Daphnia magna]|uniref:uncharacterized protein LOC116927568 n=1 Tax=Daphnia magna TaxID=35525 RepID=UPI001E1BD31B|nr:uncharacterized protein LOC116927568 [Daphnia magna]